MSNQKQLRIVKEDGVEAWNKWRKDNPYATVDLYTANLRSTNLTEANLTGADFRYANLTEVNLTKANLIEANLTKANLTEVNLTKANLTKANLTKANLAGANLTDANLTDANLSGTKIDEKTKLVPKWRKVWEIVNQGAASQDLSGADLSDANLTDANLTGANLTDANLTGANLTGANLRGADFRCTEIDKNTKLDSKWRKVWVMVNQGAEGQDLSGADLNGDNLTGANLNGDNLTGANLTDANLTGANLSGANLSRADLTGANFRWTKIDKNTKLDSKWRKVWVIVNQGAEGQNLSGAHLSDANLSDANLSDANLTGANLSGADLSDANLTDANLIGAELNGANLTKANLIEANLTKANLTKANLTDANLTKANLTKANLTKANLTEVNLSDTNLIEANLTKANLTKANLTDANLTKANLTKANLIEANLAGADLRGTKIDKNTKLVPKWHKVWEIVNQGAASQDLSDANLSGANLIGANLTDANLSDANLSGAILVRVQALKTIFDGAILTGACIEDWNINSETNFDNVICNYIYLKEGKQERRPSDPNRNFEPGEFTKLVQKSVETVDLIFKDGIDWQAFLSSYQDIQVEAANGELAIQGIERKTGGAFIVRVEVPPDADKASIEASFWEKYNPLLEAKDKEIKLLSQQTEFYSEQVEIIRKDNTRLLGIVETMVEKETSKVNMTFNAPVTGVAGNVEGNQNIYASEEKQTLAEAAAEIQKLLQQLEQNNPDATPEQQQAYVNAAIPPTLKQRCVGALKAGGETAIEEFLDNPYVNVGKAVVKAWIKPE